jgi:hypothetical protein
MEKQHFGFHSQNHLICSGISQAKKDKKLVFEGLHHMRPPSFSISVDDILSGFSILNSVDKYNGHLPFLPNVGRPPQNTFCKFFTHHNHSSLLSIIHN